MEKLKNKENVKFYQISFDNERDKIINEINYNNILIWQSILLSNKTFTSKNIIKKYKIENNIESVNTNTNSSFSNLGNPNSDLENSVILNDCENLSIILENNILESINSKNLIKRNSSLLNNTSFNETINSTSTFQDFNK